MMGLTGLKHAMGLQERRMCVCVCVVLVGITSLMLVVGKSGAGEVVALAQGGDGIYGHLLKN